MKRIKAMFAAGLILLSSSAVAIDMPWDDDRHDRWRGDNRWGNNFDFFDDIWGDMFGDMAGDFDFEIRIRANAEGWGRGRGKGRGDNYWRGDQRFRGNHRYYDGPYRPYRPYRHPGIYRGHRPALPPHRLAPYQRPPAQAAPGQARTSRAPAQAAPARRAPTQPRTAPQMQQAESPWSTEPAQQPAWATETPASTQKAP